MDFVAGPVEEARIDEGNPVPRKPDALLEIDGGSPFLVHDADLDGVPRQAKNFLDPGKDPVGEANLLGAVQLRLDDIDRSEFRIPSPSRNVMHRDQDRADGIQQPLEHRFAAGIGNRRKPHEETDIPDQHQRLPLEDDFASVASGEFPVRLQPPPHPAPVLGEFRLEVALHQPQPVPVGQNLVLGVDHGNRILAVHDGGHRRFQDNVGYAGPVRRTDRIGPVDDDLDMKPVVAEQNRLGRVHGSLPADKLIGFLQRRRPDAAFRNQPAAVQPIAFRFPVRNAGERERIVEKRPDPVHDTLAPFRVVGAAGRRLTQDIRAVKGIVE